MQLVKLNLFGMRKNIKESCIIIDKPCSLCGSIEYVLKFYKNDFQIVKCIKCGLVKTILPEDLDLGLIYDEDYFQGGQSDGYADYIGSEKIIKKEFNRILQVILKLVEPGSDNHLLEIGCAYGFFLDLAKDHFKCSGIEISTHASENARKICKNVICGTPDRETMNAIGKFNIVVMLDVIEHLPNLSDTLKAISDILPERGIVVLTTGNIESLFSRISGKYWRLMTPPQHVTFFSRNSITKLFEKYGLNILELSVPVKFVPIGLVLYQLTRIINIRLPKLLFKLLDKVFLPINLFDTMRVIGVKSEK